MFLIIVIAIIVLIILAKVGVFRKPAECRACGRTLKGTEQIKFGPDGFVLCRDCASKINPQIMPYAKMNWSFADYQDYLAWEDETKEIRSQFNPDFTYAYGFQIDTERGLFSLPGGDMVFRFADLTDYAIDFKPEEIKQGILNDKVSGEEFVTVEFSKPRVYLECILKDNVKLKLRSQGFINPKYQYEFNEDFSEAIRVFTICIYVELDKRNSSNVQTQDIGEVEKALALFMFDSMDDVTESNLKKQRNALIKAFHPDNDESNEVYSQKINAAYELLSGMIKK